jgi:hypothetical protein
MSKTLFHYTPVVRAVVIPRDGVIRSIDRESPAVCLAQQQSDE